MYFVVVFVKQVDWLIDLCLTPTLAIFQLNGGFKTDLVIEESGHGL
jgi:hypothetical protein